jgi:multidrug efflux pump subunit AcrB
VDWCVEWRKTVIAITLAALALGIGGFRFIEQQFFPDSSRLELVVDLWLPEGSSLQATEDEARAFERWLGASRVEVRPTSARARRASTCRRTSSSAEQPRQKSSSP